MSVYLQDRRKFMKLTLAASSLSFAPSLGFAFGPAEESDGLVSQRQIWNVHSLGTLFSRERRASWPIMRPAAGGITRSGLTGNCPSDSIHQSSTRTPSLIWPRCRQQYMVFTTKHHDGFCMFNTSYTEYKITSASVWQGHCEATGGCLQRTRHAPRVLLLSPTCTILHFATHRSWRRTTGTANQHVPSGLST